MVRVKICGITNEKDLKNSIIAGADALGFVINVDSSPRSIKIDRARELMEKVPIFVSKVAVTVFDDFDRIIEIKDELKPEYIQIHGDFNFNEDYLLKTLCGVHIIRAIALKSNLSLESILNEAKNFDAILVDSHIEGKYGGTGIVNDFKMCREIGEAISPKPLILAGGLNPDNVEEAIHIVKPFAVDVSSGVELSLGIKDYEKMLNFVANAKRVKN
ncbi:MAG: phosphoribosylanthranilate isomerase [archaeon]|nr:phosphoribosylanthranilate isomerase [archaeon]MCP8319584.1 phosphoribosylanthranilate isomerase [archaeon]